VPSGARARSAIPDLHHEDVRLHVHGGGFVLQVTAVGTAPDGAPIRVPSCLVVTVRDGRITRFEEYADSAAAGPVLTAVAAASRA
jgi:ketosteroid isomerase-like protein